MAQQTRHAPTMMHQKLQATMMSTPQPTPRLVRRNAHSSTILVCSARLPRLPGRQRLQTVAQNSNNERNNYNARKGKQFENAKRRRGRPVSGCLLETTAGPGSFEDA